MSEIITPTTHFVRKIKCPRHFLLDPKQDPFERELCRDMKNVSESMAKHFGVSRYKIKRDKHGEPIRNNKAFVQPEISASFAIEHIWDPKNEICARWCRGRCKRGKETINELSIKRLHG
jgi:hypothetical protein